MKAPLSLTIRQQATAETVDLGSTHPPKEDSIKAFNEILPDLKHELIHSRREKSKHEKEYFAAVENLSDEDLTAFTADNLQSVRVAMSAYGVHLFGKVHIPSMPESGPAFIHIRIFIGSDKPPRLHSIHTEEKDDGNGGKTFRAIFTKDDTLEWFDT